jgi:hypothetical protein
MTTDLLEHRLENLAVETPDPGRVSARVLARAPRPRRRRWPRIALSSVATFVLLALVAYFVPAADLVVAKVPLAGDWLRDAGLVGARDRITMVGSSASSSGYTVTLVGAYADSTRTVLLVHSNPPSIPGGGFETVLQDQFGRSYQFQGSVTDTRTGDETMQFEPLAWPDALTGARITLQISSIDTATATGPRTSVAGTWTLRATLGVDVAQALPLPEPASLGAANFRFTSVTYTPATIEVDIEVTGVSADYLWRRIPDGGKGKLALQIELVDPSGQVINGNGGSGGDQSATQIRFFGFRESGAGSYLLRVTLVGDGTFERVLKIP